jgi:hypothetical protein
MHVGSLGDVIFETDAEGGSSIIAGPRDKKHPP